MKRSALIGWGAALTAAAFAGWAIFTASSSLPELLLGAGCALFTGIFCTAMSNRLGLLVTPSLRDLAEGWRIPWYLLTDTVVVLKVLACDLMGHAPAPHLLAVPFELRVDDRSRFRSALAVAYSSATPNTIVLGIDQHEHLMLLHQLQKSNIQVMTRHLGALMEVPAE